MADEATTKTEETAAGARAQILKLAVEVGPLVLFFIVNARAGIFWGTGVLMVGTVIALIASRFMFDRFR